MKLPSKRVYVLLSLMWGLPLTLFGAIVSAVLLLAGYRPKRFCYCIYFEVGENWGGLEMGLFFLKDKTPSLRLMAHEQGHGLQNIRYGFLMPFIVTIPSAIRYWYRRIAESRGKQLRTPYNSIWFEREADELGTQLYNKLKIDSIIPTKNNKVI